MKAHCPSLSENKAKKIMNNVITATFLHFY